MTPFPLEAIRDASQRQLAAERQEAAEIVETTPRDLSPAIDAFARTLGGSDPAFIPVVPDPHGLYGWCSDGVREKIRHDGGRCLFGWTIWEWPGVMATAEFHAVWESGAEELLDITPKPKEETRILFVPDRNYPEDFDFDMRPRNRRHRLYTEQDAAPTAASLNAALSGAKRQYEEKRARKAGRSLEDWLLAKVPRDPLAEKIDLLIATCDAFDEHFDTLGTAGLVAVDKKFEALMQRRLTLQRDVKREVQRRLLATD